MSELEERLIDRRAVRMTPFHNSHFFGALHATVRVRVARNLFLCCSFVFVGHQDMLTRRASLRMGSGVVFVRHQDKSTRRDSLRKGSGGLQRRSLIRHLIHPPHPRAILSVQIVRHQDMSIRRDPLRKGSGVVFVRQVDKSTRRDSLRTG